MEASTPLIFIKGIDGVIRKDLEKHKGLLLRSKDSLLAYRSAVSHQIKRKRHYRSLLGGGKFDDVALQKAIDAMAVDLRQCSDKVKLTEDEIAHHSLIVDTLSGQLDEYHRAKQARDEFIDATSH